MYMKIYPVWRPDNMTKNSFNIYKDGGSSFKETWESLFNLTSKDKLQTVLGSYAAFQQFWTVIYIL